MVYVRRRGGLWHVLARADGGVRWACDGAAAPVDVLRTWPRAAGGGLAVAEAQGEAVHAAGAAWVRADDAGLRARDGAAVASVRSGAGLAGCGGLRGWPVRGGECADAVAVLPGGRGALVATYNAGADGRRTGRVQVAERDDLGAWAVRGASSELPGVLDVALAPWGDGGAALAPVASGDVCVLRLLGDGGGPEVAAALRSAHLSPPSDDTQRVLCLAAAAAPSAAGDVAATYSDGHVALLDAAAGRAVRAWAAHGLEAWSVARAPADAALLATGGDDQELRLWDARGPAGASAANVGGRGAFAAGVTALRFVAGDALLAGTYAGALTLWDLRAPAAPLAAADVAGGVWRLQPRGARVAVAAMHAGFAVADVCAAEGAVRVARAWPLEWPDWLAYGVDWLADDELLGCSFYHGALWTGLHFKK